MRKLVELDPASMMTKEFDLVKIRRSAEALRNYLLGLSSGDDQYRIRDLVLPIVEEALAGRLVLPFDVHEKPLRYESVEGLLPQEYVNLSAPFFLSITGMSGLGSDLIKPIHKDGKLFAWMEFEGEAGEQRGPGVTH